MKELEKITYRALQKSFSQVMAQTLLEIDEAIALGRDKKRFYLKDKRPLNFESVFGSVELKRNYYQDRETGQYVYLLDQYLDFDGTKGMSPVVQDMAIELAVTGVSYRQASDAMEKLLGYPVISHEGIRQQLLNTEVLPASSIPLEQDVVFVEVDGLYTKSQEKGKKGREVKIASVHQGWEMNGKRAKLKEKRHFIHEGKLPFWEEFEQYLMDTYDYDTTHHQLVINRTGVINIPVISAYNKIDLAEKTRIDVEENHIYMSAKTKQWIDELSQSISKLAFHDYVRCELFIPYEEGQVVSFLMKVRMS